MKTWLLFLVLATAVHADRVSDLDIQDGTLQQSNTALNFPAISSAYVVGRRFRSLFEVELARAGAVHGDLALGEQFVGGSMGYTFSSFGNFSLLSGLGYDMDYKGWDWFAGASASSSLLSLGSLKTFLGYDFLLSRFRTGIAYALLEKGNWKLDAVGTAKFIGRRNFLGLSLNYDLLRGAGGKALQSGLGAFVGYDFDEEEKSHLGAGISANIRF